MTTVKILDEMPKDSVQFSVFWTYRGKIWSNLVRWSDDKQEYRIIDGSFGDDLGDFNPIEYCRAYKEGELTNLVYLIAENE